MDIVIVMTYSHKIECYYELTLMPQFKLIN